MLCVWFLNSMNKGWISLGKLWPNPSIHSDIFLLEISLFGRGETHKEFIQVVSIGCKLTEANCKLLVQLCLDFTLIIGIFRPVSITFSANKIPSILESKVLKEINSQFQFLIEKYIILSSKLHPFCRD